MGGEQVSDAQLDGRTNSIPAGAELRLDSVFKSYTTPARGTLQVLEGLSLTARPGEFVALVGPSGCGKTTLLRLIGGLESPDDGSVEVPGAARIGFVFQRPTLLPWRSVRENIMFGVNLASGQNGPDGSADLDDLLELVGLADFADYTPAQLSGGMQQRVNLARALAIRPRVLLLDEPFSALDALTRERLQRDVGHILSSLGTTVLLVTHDIREAVFFADRVLVMASDPARIVESVSVDHPRPRGVDFQLSQELSRLSHGIWDVLNAPTARQA